MRLTPCFLIAACLAPAAPAQVRPQPPVVDPATLHDPQQQLSSEAAGSQSPRDQDGTTVFVANRPVASSTPNGGDQNQSAPVPEPGTLLLVGTGLVGVALTARGRRRRGQAG